jgi:hypothetical protein
MKRIILIMLLSLISVTTFAQFIRDGDTVKTLRPFTDWFFFPRMVWRGNWADSINARTRKADTASLLLSQQRAGANYWSKSVLDTNELTTKLDTVNLTRKNFPNTFQYGQTITNTGLSANLLTLQNKDGKNRLVQDSSGTVTISIDSTRLSAASLAIGENAIYSGIRFLNSGNPVSRIVMTMRADGIRNIALDPLPQGSNYFNVRSFAIGTNASTNAQLTVKNGYSGASSTKITEWYNSNGVLIGDRDSSGGGYFLSNVGIGVAAGNGMLNVLSATEPLRLSYDDTYSMSFVLNNRGKLTLGTAGTTTNRNGVLMQSRVQYTDYPQLELAPNIQPPVSIIANTWGLKITPTVTNNISGAEATNYYGIYSTNPTGTGSITNVYGAYIEGNVGLGTTSPLSKLAVIGSYATNLNLFNFVNSDINIGRATIAQATDSSSAHLTSSATGNLTFHIVDKTGATQFQSDSLATTLNGSTPIKGIWSATRVYDCGSIAAGVDSTFSVTCTGAVAGNPVSLGISVAAEAGLIITAECTTNDAVTVRISNHFLVSAVDPASRTFRVMVANF